MNDDITWIEIEPARRKAVAKAMPLPRAYTHYTMVDGVTIYRCKTKLKVSRGKFGSVTVQPPLGRTLEYAIGTCLELPIRPSDEAIALHDELVASSAS